MASAIPANKLTQQATEDYLKTIYVLAETGSPVITTRIAQARGVKPASVTYMLQRLSTLKLVHYRKHQGVILTQAGRAIALKILRSHRLITLYLTEVLGFGWDEVQEEAEILEHVLSEKLEERIAIALDQPALNREQIPTKDGTAVAATTQQQGVLHDHKKQRAFTP